MSNLRVEKAKLKLLINCKYGSYGTKKDFEYYNLSSQYKKVTNILKKIEIRKKKIEKLLNYVRN